MINIGTYIIGSLKKNWYVIFFIMVFLFGVHLANVFIKNKKQIEEYQRIEQETKEFHQEKIQELKETLNNAKNAKKIDYNDGGNIDDDFLLKALE
jgi:CHASE3 domain sensor protein